MDPGSIPDRDAMAAILRAVAIVLASNHGVELTPDATALGEAADLGFVDLSGREPRVTDLGLADLEAHLSTRTAA